MLAKFVGSLQDFHDFTGPKVRNDIATMTKKFKVELGYKCQKCGMKKELDAAHKHGFSRRTIIERTLESYLNENGEYKIDDLRKALDKIKKAHQPIENYFLFLCKDCHRKYDGDASAKNQTRPDPPSDAGNYVSVRDNHDDEILCKDETTSWKYKLGWTSMQNRKNIENLISLIDQNFGCIKQPRKSWLYFYRQDNRKQFAAIMTNKNDSSICFRIDPRSFTKSDTRVDRTKRWFFQHGREGKISIIPENYDLILECLHHSYNASR